MARVSDMRTRTGTTSTAMRMHVARKRARALTPGATHGAQAHALLQLEPVLASAGALQPRQDRCAHGEARSGLRVTACATAFTTTAAAATATATTTTL